MDPKHFEKPVPLWHNPSYWRIREMLDTAKQARELSDES